MDDGPEFDFLPLIIEGIICIFNVIVAIVLVIAFIS